MSFNSHSRTLILKTLRILFFAYLIICALLFLFQEKFIFFPEKLNKEYRFKFSQPFEEKFIPVGDKEKLNGLLFRSDSSKGLVLFLHGNAGSIYSWGEVASTYTELNYDVFVLDYRGYGKSEGVIKSQEQFYNDVQAAYDEMKKNYPENKIIVAGYSIGTGPATYLAANNTPKLLLLHAPYYNLTNMLRRYYPIIPGFLLKYKFRTNELIQRCKMPVVIFHGDIDEVIPYKSSLQLQKLFKPQDSLITIHNQSHNGIIDNSEYKRSLAGLLKN